LPICLAAADVSAFLPGVSAKKELAEAEQKLLALLYAPGLLVLGVWFLFVNGILEVFPSPVDFRNFLETISDVHLGVYFA